MKFTYTSGQRPLDGFTLKRGIGHGGFGEVYYAISDGGKEVALKLIRDNLDVELRGVVQCLNLKHPNLVNLYDLRTDAKGAKWVVMEFIEGESLNTVLHRHPTGLPAELAQQWFVAFSKAVSYLHDHGIVHRDLKPGNIFLEHGIIKVGDYGLSKCITGSQQAAQTQSVGTVYYMAPEIGSGNYNKQIDVYAAGVILYELVSGKVPFDGESTNEILMKHLTSRPDLDKVPREYRSVLAKALAKNPDHRFASIAEMAKAVESVGERRNPAPPPVVVQPQVHKKEPAVLDVIPAATLYDRLGELSGSLALSAVLSTLCVIFWAALRQALPNREAASWIELGSLYFQTVLVSWAVLIPSKFWSSRTRNGWARRLTLFGTGAAVGLTALWLDGWVTRSADNAANVSTSGTAGWLPVGRDLTEMAGALSYFAVALFAQRWWRLSDVNRSKRFAFLPLLSSGFWGCLLLLLWQQWLSALALVLAAGIVQLSSPWEQPPTAPAKRVRLRLAR